MTGLRWNRIWAVVVADLVQLARQRTAMVLAAVLFLTGVGMAVASARVDPAVVLARMLADKEDIEALEDAPVVCEGAPKIAVTGALPAYVRVPGERVADGDPEAVVGVQWAPGGPLDGELLYWVGPAGTSEDLDAFVACVRVDIIDEWDRRHAALGITYRRFEVIRLRRHAPPRVERSFFAPRLRWLEPDLPVGLDLFEVMAAFFAMLLASGQVVDGILRNRVSGWEETLGISGLAGWERVVARVLGSVVLSSASMGMLCLGGLAAAPFTGLFVSPVRVLVSMLTPLSVAVVLVWVSRSAVDVRSATAQVVIPFALLLYAVFGAVALDLVWLPVGGPLVLAVFGGTALEWGVGISATVVPTMAVVWLAGRAVPDVRTNHGERSSAAARHAAGRFVPEALLLCALAFWAMIVLPLVAGESVVAAHLVGQVVGLGGIALIAPLALGLPVRRTLGLHRPTARGWLAGGLLPVATLPLMMLLIQVQLDAGWVDPEMMQRLEEFGSDAVAPLAEPLGGALIWAVPGSMEELMFRGAILGLLLPRGSWRRSRVRTLVVLGVQAAAFGLLHILAARWLPTGALGLVLGVLALRTGSILPGIVTHMVHNLLAVTVLASIAPEGTVDPWLAGGLALLVVPLLWWAGTGRQAAREPSHGG